MNLDFILHLVFLTIMLIFIGYSFFNRRDNNNSSLKGVLLWLLILAALILVYAFRFELTQLKDRFLSVLIPNYQFENKKGELLIARNNDGHFYLDGYAKSNQKIRFLVDTGASDIALTLKDAQKLGFDVQQIDYTRRYHTANGVVLAAPVVINRLRIGKKIFYNVKASIGTNGLDISLLGMSLIAEFSHFKINNDFLILGY